MSVRHVRLQTVQQKAEEHDDRRWRELWEIRDGEGLPDLPRSLPIRVWALLQSGPLAPKDVGGLLNCQVSRVSQAVGSLRRHGQSILTHKGKYHLRESPPLRITEGPRGLTLAPVDAKSRENEAIIDVPGMRHDEPTPEDGGEGYGRDDRDDRNKRNDSNGKQQRQTTKAKAKGSRRSYRKLTKKPTAEERHSTASARLRCELATINERLAKTREQIEDVRGERDWLRRMVRAAESKPQRRGDAENDHGQGRDRSLDAAKATADGNGGTATAGE